MLASAVAGGRAPAPNVAFVISGQLGSTAARRRVRALIMAFAVAIAVAAVDAAALAPGTSCAASGKAYKFFAQSWANTCDCDGGAFPPQKRGDQCNWWQKPCGYCCDQCPTTSGAFTCKRYARRAVPRNT